MKDTSNKTRNTEGQNPLPRSKKDKKKAPAPAQESAQAQETQQECDFEITTPYAQRIIQDIGSESLPRNLERLKKKKQKLRYSRKTPSAPQLEDSEIPRAQRRLKNKKPSRAPQLETNREVIIEDTPQELETTQSTRFLKLLDVPTRDLINSGHAQERLENPHIISSPTEDLEMSDSPNINTSTKVPFDKYLSKDKRGVNKSSNTPKSYKKPYNASKNDIIIHPDHPINKMSNADVAQTFDKYTKNYGTDTNSGGCSFLGSEKKTLQPTDNGYHQLYVKNLRKRILWHQVCWRLTHLFAKIPENFIIHQTCGNTLCGAKHHLSAVHKSIDLPEHKQCFYVADQISKTMMIHCNHDPQCIPAPVAQPVEKIEQKIEFFKVL
jgi:hypothetical protein